MKPHSYKLHELREIFRLLGQGRAPKEIAVELFIPVHKVYYAVRNYGDTVMASESVRDGSSDA